MAGRTHRGPPNRPISELLNEHDETSAAFDWKFGFEFRPVVHGADLLQLLRNSDVMQPAAPVLSADYVLCTRVHCVRGEHTRFAGRSGWQRRHIDNRRSPIFGNANFGLRMPGGRADRRLGGSRIAADKLALAIHHHLWCVRPLSTEAPGVLLLPRAEGWRRRGRPSRCGSSSRRVR